MWEFDNWNPYFVIFCKEKNFNWRQHKYQWGSKLDKNDKCRLSKRPIQISNILGFNQYYNHAKLIKLDMKNYEIFFGNINCEFYLNKISIIKEMCKHENFYGKSIEYFLPMKNLIFNYEAYVGTKKKVCFRFLFRFKPKTEQKPKNRYFFCLNRNRNRKTVHFSDLLWLNT